MSEECLAIETRKLQKTKTSYIVVLPQLWVKSFGWKPGQLLILYKTRDGIIIKALRGE